MRCMIFLCPTTGEPVDVGIESELTTLLRIRDQKVRARCPRCNEIHEWEVRDAQIGHAA